MQVKEFGDEFDCNFRRPLHDSLLIRKPRFFDDAHVRNERVVCANAGSDFHVRFEAELLVLVQKSREQFTDSVLQPVVSIGCGRHLDDLTSDELVFDSVAVLIEFVGQSEVLLGSDECRSGHTRYSSVVHGGKIRAPLPMSH